MFRNAGVSRAESGKHVFYTYHPAPHKKEDKQKRNNTRSMRGIAVPEGVGQVKEKILDEAPPLHAYVGKQ